jgi:hypothetical protein
VSHTTVARRVEALEAQLSAAAPTVTVAGTLMLPGAEAVEREVANANGVFTPRSSSSRQAGRRTPGGCWWLLRCALARLDGID